jgi:hypothetical protein
MSILAKCSYDIHLHRLIVQVTAFSKEVLFAGLTEHLEDTLKQNIL